MARTNFTALKRARSLRSNQTPAEERLWGYLRGRRLHGHKFIRQAPIGPYIVDFFCRDAAVVVEVDGATHATDDEIRHDLQRDALLQRCGLRIVGLANAYIYESLDDALGTILRALEERRGQQSEHWTEGPSSGLRPPSPARRAREKGH